MKCRELPSPVSLLNEYGFCFHMNFHGIQLLIRLVTRIGPIRRVSSSLCPRALGVENVVVPVELTVSIGIVVSWRKRPTILWGAQSRFDRVGKKVIIRINRRVRVISRRIPCIHYCDMATLVTGDKGVTVDSLKYVV